MLIKTTIEDFRRLLRDSINTLKENDIIRIRKKDRKGKLIETVFYKITKGKRKETIQTHLGEFPLYDVEIL